MLITVLFIVFGLIEHEPMPRQERDDLLDQAVRATHPRQQNEQQGRIQHERRYDDQWIDPHRTPSWPRRRPPRQPLRNATPETIGRNVDAIRRNPLIG